MAVRSLWSSSRVAFTSLTEAMGVFTVANLVWLCAAIFTSVVGAMFVPAYVVGLILVPVSCGLLRMAGHAARDERVRIRQLRAGASHRFWVHLALGAGQFLLLATATFNVALGLGNQGLFLALVAVVSGYVALGITVVAAAAWPLLLDPYRSTLDWRAVLRLAVAVTMKRPIGVVVLTLVTGALISLTSQTILLALVLPGYGSLVGAHYILPIADQLQGGSPPPGTGASSDAALPEV